MNKNTKISYNDYFFIENYLFKNSAEPELEMLYCIIDENKYYNDIDSMYQNIKIKKVYFLYVNSNKKINIYDSIKRYLNKIKTDYLEEIIFGEGFFEKKIYDNYKIIFLMPILELIDDIMLVKKSPIRIKSLNNINIKFDTRYFSGCNIFLKIYLGISLLFCNAKIEGIKILDIKSFNESDFKIEKNEKNLLILKIHNLLLLGEKKFKLRIYDLIKQYDYLVLYLSEKIAKNKFSKKIFFDLYKKKFLFYSEIPTKAVHIQC
jgi:hypothetical protein